jgi:hypothetical protein
MHEDGREMLSAAGLQFVIWTAARAGTSASVVRTGCLDAAAMMWTLELLGIWRPRWKLLCAQGLKSGGGQHHWWGATPSALRKFCMP